MALKLSLTGIPLSEIQMVLTVKDVKALGATAKGRVALMKAGNMFATVLNRQVVIATANSPWFKQHKLEKSYKGYTNISDFGARSYSPYAEIIDSGGTIKGKPWLAQPLVKDADRYPEPRQYPKPLSLLISRKGQMYLVLRRPGMDAVIDLRRKRQPVFKNKWNKSKSPELHVVEGFKLIYKLRKTTVIKPTNYIQKAIEDMDVLVTDMLEEAVFEAFSPNSKRW